MTIVTGLELSLVKNDIIDEIKNINKNNIEELSDTNIISLSDSIKSFIFSLNIAHPDVVYSQAVIESGNFRSKLFLNDNNMFGMKVAERRPTTRRYITENGYSGYYNWRESIIDYALWQAWSAKGLSRDAYLILLDNLYAEDELYLTKISK